MASAVVARALDPSSWPASVWLLLLTGAVTVFFRVFYRPSMPTNAPQWWKSYDLPILGAWRFYTKRAEYFLEAIKQSPGGNFSFYVGQKHIIGISGDEGRKAFFDNKDLAFAEAISELFNGQPASTGTEPNKFGPFFNKSLLSMLKRENFVNNLSTLTSDTRGACEDLAAAPPSEADPEWQVTNPFDSLYRIVFLLTMRTVGATEIAEDPKLCHQTLSLFERFEGSDSTTKVVFPWFPTPNHLARLYIGARLAGVLQKIIETRKKSGTKHQDALQFLLDQGAGIVDVISFQIAALFAGQINSGVNAAWVQTYLALSPEWMARVREEVDASVAKHRTSPDQSAADALGNLTISDWEADFPLIDLCLRESIRLNMPGTAFRKNMTGHDLPIGSTGKVIPHGAYAAYLLDDVHFNPELYAEPEKFDPGRYLEGRAEDKNVQHGYLGWGAGRHPCLGMKFAKLEMALITAYWVAMFDFELSDAQGNLSTTPPRPIDRNRVSAQKPQEAIYLRYKPRAQKA